MSYRWRRSSSWLFRWADRDSTFFKVTSTGPMNPLRPGSRCARKNLLFSAIMMLDRASVLAREEIIQWFFETFFFRYLWRRTTAFTLLEKLIVVVKGFQLEEHLVSVSHGNASTGPELGDLVYYCCWSFADRLFLVVVEKEKKRQCFLSKVALISWCHLDETPSTCLPFSSFSRW